VPLVLGVLGVAIAVGAFFVARSDEGGNSSAEAPKEILLESATDTGASPFTPAVDPPAPATAAALVNAQPVSGTTPAAGAPLYGGSGDDKVCDREAMVAYLTQNPDKGRAWAAVAGVPYDQLPSYIRSLTPTVLLYDTRVTNHGFVNGVANPIQSVLQAGTAVLVDRNGLPVAKCRCGNPLSPPVAAAPNPTYVGTPWPGFQPGVFVTIVIHVTNPTTTAPSTTKAPTTTKPGTTTTTTAKNPADRATQILVDAMTRCGKSVEPRGSVKDPDLANSYLVDAVVAGSEAQFVVNVKQATVAEGDRASAAIVEECGLG
jgi:hypothetical protein